MLRITLNLNSNENERSLRIDVKCVHHVLSLGYIVSQSRTRKEIVDMIRRVPRTG